MKAWVIQFKLKLYLFKGNDNNFETLSDCEKECTAVQGKSLDTVDPPKKEICSLPSEIGPCKAAFDRFYFNPATKKCESFIYGKIVLLLWK